jgi:hypothetical protein
VTAAVLALPPARRNQVEAVKVLVDGQVLVRLVGTPRGTWLTYRSPIDSLVAHLSRELMLHGQGSKTVIIASLCIDHAAISRCRSGQQPVREAWLLRMHEYSGIPVAELRQVAGLGAGVERHKLSRPAAGV